MGAAGEFTVSVCVLVTLCVCGGGAGTGELLDQYGPFSIVLHSRILKCNHSRTLGLDVSQTRAYLYDFLEEATYVYSLHEASSSALAARLDRSRTLVVFVPGFHTDVQGKSCGIVRDAFARLRDAYLLIVDHSAYTSGGGYLAAYERSVRYSHDLGEALASLLSPLLAAGVPVRCAGHSLGAQLLGVAGGLLRERGAVLPRVTALDPAGPCFSEAPVQDQVRSGAAQYVEVYHCNAGELGSARTLGDADFFANGGERVQPACSRRGLRGAAALLSARAARCSHLACVRQYAATVHSGGGGYVASRCRAASADPIACRAPGAVALAGYWSTGRARGVYYYDTHTSYDDAGDQDDYSEVAAADLPTYE